MDTSTIVSIVLLLFGVIALFYKAQTHQRETSTEEKETRGIADSAQVGKARAKGDAAAASVHVRYPD